MRGILPFRFENMWLKEEGFKNLVNEWWCSLEIKRLRQLGTDKETKSY